MATIIREQKRSFTKSMLGATVAVAAMSTSAVVGAHLSEVLFWSTQARPIEETQAMREQVLSGFEGGVDYQANDGGPWPTRLQAELQAGTGTIGLLGALHGDFTAMARPISSICRSLTPPA